MTTQTFTRTLELIECATCHMDFGMTPEFNEQARRTHETFCCPAGHRQQYNGESDVEREKRLRGYAESRRYVTNLNHPTNFAVGFGYDTKEASHE